MRKGGIKTFPNWGSNKTLTFAILLSFLLRINAFNSQMVGEYAAHYYIREVGFPVKSVRGDVDGRYWKYIYMYIYILNAVYDSARSYLTIIVQFQPKSFGISDVTDNKP